MQNNKIILLLIWVLIFFLLGLSSCKDKTSRKYFSADKSYFANTVWEGVEVVNGENDIDRLEFRGNDSVGLFRNSYTIASDKYGGYEYGLDWFKYSIIDDSTLRIEDSGKSQEFIISENGEFIKPKGGSYVSRILYIKD